MTKQFKGHGLALSASKGFTLIELLVVIAIIGILSSVVLASLTTARAKGRDTRRVSDIKQLQLALELYYDSNAAYPATTAPLAGSFISTIPTDPSTGAAYSYYGLGTATCTGYHLGATLEVENNSVFTTDSDAAAATTCTGSATPDFTSTSADLIYDVKP